VDRLSPTGMNNPAGDAIEFEWEMPWLDFGDRTTSKNSKYIAFDARGASEFTVQMYVDNMTTATLETEFSAGDQGAFGGGAQPYGGGRNTSRRKLYAWPAKFQIARFKFFGSTDAALKFVAVSLHYREGSIRP
jgi:hypothetical protein